MSRSVPARRRNVASLVYLEEDMATSLRGQRAQPRDALGHDDLAELPCSVGGRCGPNRRQSSCFPIVVTPNMHAASFRQGQTRRLHHIHHGAQHPSSLSRLQRLTQHPEQPLQTDRAASRPQQLLLPGPFAQPAASPTAQRPPLFLAAYCSRSLATVDSQQQRWPLAATTAWRSGESCSGCWSWTG